MAPAEPAEPSEAGDDAPPLAGDGAAASLAEAHRDLNDFGPMLRQEVLSLTLLSLEESSGRSALLAQLMSFLGLKGTLFTHQTDAVRCGYGTRSLAPP